jgi:predicted RNA binding protein YcfA (HicA-like mRNA interferase family)
MPKPFAVRLVVKTLEAHGFFFVSQTGSHAKYRKEGSTTLTVIVPIHGKEIRYGTFRSILRQSGLKESDFQKGKK